MGSKARNAMDLTSSKESKHSGIRSYSFTRMLKKTLPSIIPLLLLWGEDKWERNLRK
jgi:hypothetical protein